MANQKPEDLALPAALAEIAAIGFKIESEANTDEDSDIDSREPNDFGERYMCDFEFYEEFEPQEETTDWFRSWTGNDEVDGSEFRIFGMTGSGSYVGFWLVRPNAIIAEQPIVFLDSEGELGVIAKDLGDLLLIFANGSGPNEAFYEPRRKTKNNQAFREIAERFGRGENRSTYEIISSAKSEFPSFEATIQALCR